MSAPPAKRARLVAKRARSPAKRARSLALNCLCTLLSLAAALAACEAALRLFHPRYHHAAEARREPDEQRIWKPPPNSHYRFSHPDTGRLHRVMHNNLGARQHRNFHPEDLGGAVNLAFFGDSFGENLRLPAQYSFHDVLDFLLNANAPPNADGGSARRFNVLNFGVDGYATGQEYIHYRGVREVASLHHVFYLFVRNDIEDTRRNGIYSLDESGRLVERLPPKTPLWVRMLARAHLTYLAMDSWERLRREWLERFPSHGKRDAEDSPAPPSEIVTDPDAIRLWRSVVLRWQREVENGGARFTVVILPHPRYTQHMQHVLASLPDSVETLSLGDCFRSTVSDPPPTHMLRFENDGHWNEAANMVAAHCLYRFLEERLGLPPASDEALARERHRYYRAFAEAPDWEGGRWMPEPPWVLPAGAPSAGTIVEKYLALERSPARLDEHWRRVVRSAKAERPLARAAWDVYAIWDQRLLVYIKKPCRDEDMQPVFFIHLYPANRKVLERNEGNRRHRSTASDFVDLRRFFTLWREGDECVVGVQLPAWEISRARTGQFVRTVDDGADGTARINNVWAAELRLRQYPD